MHTWLTVWLSGPARLLGGIAGALITAYALEYVWGWEPCPLCHVQRWILGWVAIAQIGASIATYRHNRVGQRIGSWLTGIGIAAGAAVSLWHVWVRLHPIDALASCAPPFSYWLQSLPWIDALWAIGASFFANAPSCAQGSDALLGLPLPVWTVGLWGLLGYQAWQIHAARFSDRTQSATRTNKAQ